MTGRKKRAYRRVDGSWAVTDENGKIVTNLPGNIEIPTPVPHPPGNSRTDRVQAQNTHSVWKGRMDAYTTVVENMSYGPVPHLFDIVDENEYVQAVQQKHVNVHKHPELPYLLHNYSDQAVWEQNWNTATLTCRGLVTHAETGAVVARPYPKFFNHNQPGAPAIAPSDRVVVTDKADGSLGVLVPVPGGGTHVVATRGRWGSEQAAVATRMWQEKYDGRFIPNPRWTYLYEIVYPENRIVLNYEGLHDLILLGAVDIRSGATVTVEEASEDWPGPKVETFSYTTFAQALAAPARENAEGYVVWVPEKDVRVKLKQDDYKRLHAIMTNTSERKIWEAMRAGVPVSETASSVPDEFHAWLREVETGLQDQHDVLMGQIVQEHETILARLADTPGWGRKEYAGLAKQSRHTPALFKLLDGTAPDDYVWQKICPPPNQERKF